MRGVSLCEALGSVINGHTGDNNGVTSTHSSGCGKQNGAEHLDENKPNINMETKRSIYVITTSCLNVTIMFETVILFFSSLKQ